MIETVAMIQCGYGKKRIEGHLEGAVQPGSFFLSLSMETMEMI